MPDQVNYTLRMPESGQYTYNAQSAVIDPNTYLWKRSPESFCQGNYLIFQILYLTSFRYDYYCELYGSISWRSIFCRFVDYSICNKCNTRSIECKFIVSYYLNTINPVLRIGISRSFWLSSVLF
jgi:hypothetical protein